MSVRIIECTSPTELYRHYDGETDAQGAYIELDLREGTLLADYNGQVGNAVPEAVFHGLERRYNIPTLTGEAANRVLRELAPLADRILADWDSEWNGQSTIAVLGDDALAAEEEIEKLLGLNLAPHEIGSEGQGFADVDIVAEWDVDGATNGLEAEEYDITGNTTDARLAEIAGQITSDMAECASASEDDERTPVAVVHGLDEYLTRLRDDLADEEPLTGAELRAARELLGITSDHLAKVLGVNPRTVRSWEQGRDAIPGRIRTELAEIKAAADAAVRELVDSLGDDDAVITYRNDEEYKAAHPRGKWSAAWHRQVAQRAADEANVRLDYAGDAGDA